MGKDSAPAVSEEVREPAVERSATVLIIDDSPTVQALVTKALREHDVCGEILAAGNGAEGYRLLCENRVDLVLCDIEMPEFDGHTFLALKGENRDLDAVPVIILTATAGDLTDKVRGFDAGASDYLVKPCHVREIAARVDVHLQAKLLRDKLRERNEQLEELSRTDSLTQIANRRHLMEVLRSEFARAERYETPLSLVLLDIDHFKRINDTHGHQAGDQVLVAVAKAIKSTARFNDVVGRYGGEELLVLLPNTPSAGASIVAERYRGLVQRLRVNEISVTVSVGVAEYPTDGIQSADDLLRLADQAMYAAKAAGRNCVRSA